MSRCTRPPAGWWCSREAGHQGPCPARIGKPSVFQRLEYWLLNLGEARDAAQRARGFDYCAGQLLRGESASQLAMQADDPWEYGVDHFGLGMFEALAVWDNLNHRLSKYRVGGAS